MGIMYDSSTVTDPLLYLTKPTTGSLDNVSNTMSKSNNTQKTRMFNLLAKGNEVSIAEATRRLSIANPSAVVSALREDGHVIWTNRRTTKTGATVFVYRYDAARSASNLR